ncbi:MAG: hypothetical protein V1678_05000 [Candidatus Aenigmatarchaeota archaeon]
MKGLEVYFDKSSVISDFAYDKATHVMEAYKLDMINFLEGHPQAGVITNSVKNSVMIIINQKGGRRRRLDNLEDFLSVVNVKKVERIEAVQAMQDVKSFYDNFIKEKGHIFMDVVNPGIKRTVKNSIDEKTLFQYPEFEDIQTLAQYVTLSRKGNNQCYLISGDGHQSGSLISRAIQDKFGIITGFSGNILARIKTANYLSQESPISLYASS